MNLSRPLLLVAALVTGCVTTTGSYRLEAYDPSGTRLAPDMALGAQGAAIYTARNALCAKFPAATVRIFDAQTAEEFKDESPYRCPR